MGPTLTKLAIILDMTVIKFHNRSCYPQSNLNCELYLESTCKNEFTTRNDMANIDK
jgi:hypothetical protein